MEIDSGICRPDGADDRFGFCFYKDVTPTAFVICTLALIEYDANKMAVEAWRSAFEIGLGGQSETAIATSPLTGFLN